MSSIKKNKPDLNDEQLEIIEYGLEGLYLTTIKIIIIILLSIILNIFKENQVTPINSEEVIMDLFRKKF